MFLTKASEYAFFGLMNLDGCDKPKDIETISSELKISKSFLAKILQNLARAGILRSFKGIKGGFCLARSAEEITVKEILDAVESKKRAFSSARQNCVKCAENTAKWGVMSAKFLARCNLNLTTF